MNFIDYLYVNIYASSARNNFNPKRVDPNMFASMVLGLGLGGWVSCLISYIYSIKHNSSTGEDFKYISIIIAIVFIGLVNWFYTRNNRYMILYEKFNQKNKWLSKGKVVLVAMLFILLPYIVLLVVFLA